MNTYVACAVLFLALFAVGCSRGEPSKTVRISSGEYRWGSDASTPYSPIPDLNREPPGRHGASELHVRFVVPDIAVDDPAIVAASTLRRGFVGGEERRTYPRFSFLLPLEHDDLGRVIELVFMGEHRMAIEDIEIGSERALVIDYLESDLFQYGAGAALVLVGTLLALFSVTKKGVRLYLWMALFLVPLGIALIYQSTAYHRLITTDEEAFSRVWSACLMLYPIGIVMFSVEVFGDTSRRLLLRLSQALAIATALALALDLLHLFPIRSSKAVAVPLELVGTALAIRRAWQQRQTYTAKVFIVGLATTVLLGLPDMLWGLGYPIFQFNMAPIAIFAFGVAMAAIVERTYRDKSDALVASTSDLAARVADLERRKTEIETLNDELRHQVETRSRELRHALASGGSLIAEGSREVAVGDRIGDRYRVVRHIGSGAMGAVYEVERTTDAKRFALKVMAGRVTAIDAARFAREAQMAAQVRHENLVSIFDVGMNHGAPFLVLELVDGRTLEDAAPSFGNVEWATSILCDIANGLTALHDRGIVHRDLKPANVLITRDANDVERAKIADFGIAREGASDDAKALGESDTIEVALSPRASTMADIAPTGLEATRHASDKNSLTQTGAIVGTPYYMAPEAASGRTVSSAADIFAFGLVAFEMLMNRRPYEQPAIMQAMTGGRIARVEFPQTLALDLELAAMLDATLKDDPKARPAAKDLARVLSIVTARKATFAFK